MNLIKKSLAGLFLLALVACHGPYTPVDRVQSFVDLLNAQSAYDSTFYMVKHPNQTATQGFVVVYSADTGYVAYDVSSYRVGDSWYTYSANAEYQEVYIYDSYSDYWGEVFYVGSAYANDYFGTYAGEFIFEQTEDSFKDLEKVQALKDSYKVAKLGESLSSNFGLSEERGQKVAKMVVEWQSLSKKREMTTADASIFTKEILGVDMSSAEEAFKKAQEGDSSRMNDLIGKASEVNGIGPEHMSTLIGEFITKQ